MRVHVYILKYLQTFGFFVDVSAMEIETNNDSFLCRGYLGVFFEGGFQDKQTEKVTVPSLLLTMS